jgi:hypothetical protein
VLLDLHRMEVKEDVGHDDQRPIGWVVGVAVAEKRLPELAFDHHLAHFGAARRLWEDLQLELQVNS